MGISIKHEAYERAIRELATARGLSLTDAIGLAVQNELARQADKPSKEEWLRRIRAMQARVASYPVLDDRTPDEMLYDEHGLPK
ncbi:antitoxin VapB [Sphingomonas metalli]|uniref:Antitoxin VapB n=1 Tax=Sphingomonas metalli TaxID=1779358 RepID=A0A916T1H7_9SPHN|nr:type II toxin-antitoxin system VapB family antitoxin [Sphingomonas metalli]GGB28084.1 antitoxin VapB [Sphingomonas metalli]